MIHYSQIRYDHNITKKQYLKLLDLALLRCNTFMFVVPDYDKEFFLDVGNMSLGEDEIDILNLKPNLGSFISKLASHLVCKKVSKLYAGGSYNCTIGVYFFNLNQFTKSVLEKCDTLNNWNYFKDNPEDLHFFQENSVGFSALLMREILIFILHIRRTGKSLMWICPA